MSALTSQSVMSQMAWTMGSPSVVLPFLAVALELPMLLAGALVSIRKLGNMTGDIFWPIQSLRSGKRNGPSPCAKSRLGLVCCWLS